jgi:hypothetical protein
MVAREKIDGGRALAAGLAPELLDGALERPIAVLLDQHPDRVDVHPPAAAPQLKRATWPVAELVLDAEFGRVHAP